MPEKETIAALLTRAKEAQEHVSNYTQKEIDKVIAAIGWEVYNDENIQKLAELAVSETGMGNVEDKIKKHKNKILGVLDDTLGKQSVGLIEHDVKNKIRKYAKPVGVIGALTPVTNPTATPGSNAVSILKGRNAVIFAPHPTAKKASKLAVDMMRDGLRKVGAPMDLIQIIEEPSIEKTNELMEKADLVMATGGAAMVKAAYSSGTPSYGVGPGNAVQMIAEDADIEDMANKIIPSKAFDYATSCSSENSVIVHESIYEDVLKAYENLGAYMVKGKDRKTLEEHMWKLNKKGVRAINPKIVAQSAKKIASDAGIEVPEGTRVLLVEGDDDIEGDFFSQEKLSPVMAVYRYSDFEQGYDLLRRITDNNGTGHSCGIHTFKDHYVQALGERMKTSRVMVNQGQAPANGGAFFNGMPSTVSLGCGTWGGNITTENIHYKHFLNITWVAEYFEPKRPLDATIFSILEEE